MNSPSLGVPSVAEPSVGDHLHPDGAWLRPSGRRARLVHPSGIVVARIDHDGSGILRRKVRRRSVIMDGTRFRDGVPILNGGQL
jgi:hypothetical protein